MVVVDMLNKYVHFVTIAHPFVDLQVVQAYLDNVYKLMAHLLVLFKIKTKFSFAGFGMSFLNYLAQS